LFLETSNISCTARVSRKRSCLRAWAYLFAVQGIRRPPKTDRIQPRFFYVPLWRDCEKHFLKQNIKKNQEEKMKNLFLTLIATAILMLVILHTQAQVKIGRNPGPVDTNAVLQLGDTLGKKGLLLPRVLLTSTTSPLPLGAHKAGMFVYNTNTTATGANDVTPGEYYNNGTQWVRVMDSLSTRAQAWELTGNAIPDTSQFLGTTNDVDLIFKRNGIQSGWLNKSNSNTSFGVLALPAPATNTGNSNTAFGYLTLYKNTSGRENTAIGSGALSFNTIGQNNAAVGTSALFNDTSGNANTGIGSAALNLLKSGDSNMAVGYMALGNVIKGSNNTGIGNGAGLNIQNGNNNIFIGNGTKLANDNNNQLNIGNCIFGTGMTGTAFFNGAVTNVVLVPAGNIGINTASPNSVFQVNGSFSLPVTNAASAGTATYTCANTDYTVVRSTASVTGIVLPSAANIAGRIYVVVNYVGSIINVTSVSNIISGYTLTATSYSLAAAAPTTLSKATFQSDGTNWILIGN
jgi:hypothetical protein